MSFKNLQIDYAYETFMNNPLENFLIPALSEAKSYDRIAGYFNSTSLALSARGLAGLIKNNGKMRLIASPILTEEDANEVARVSSNKPGALLRFYEKILFDLDNIDDSIIENHVAALGWMLARDFLEIKFVIPKKDCPNSSSKALFHQKVGILTDLDGNQMSFSGSANETASGWMHNIEEFKVFKSWENSPYFFSDFEKFTSFWNGARDYTETIALADAVKNRLVEIGETFSIDSLILQDRSKKSSSPKHISEPSLFSYQQEAVDEWMANNHRLLFEMATGTGKTRTAIAASLKIIQAVKKLLIIVATPQSTLTSQWSDEFENWITFDETLVFDSTTGLSKEVKLDKLKKILYKLRSGFINYATIFTTHASASGQDFLNTINSHRGQIDILFIGDETHSLGAPILKNALNDVYKYRIGLSATPSRWCDEDGTKIIEEFYGFRKFTFSLSDALIQINPATGKSFLTPYEYHPVFVSLNGSELAEYILLTKKLVPFSLKTDLTPEDEERRMQIAICRAKIVKNAESKLLALRNLLFSLDVHNTIIFTSEKLKLSSNKCPRV